MSTTESSRSPSGSPSGSPFDPPSSPARVLGVVPPQAGERGAVRRGSRVLVLGWSSVLHGEATAGDVLSMSATAQALRAAGLAVDVAWSVVMVPAGGLLLTDADPRHYTHVVWACGPLHGRAVREVLERFAGCTFLAVGVSVVDPEDEVVRAFAAVLARDAPGREPVLDLAAAPATSPAAAVAPGATPAALPVLGVFLAPGQAEYGARRRHEQVTAALGEWLGRLDAARLELDTRLDPRSWRTPATAAQVIAVVERLDAVVSMRLHGLVLALARGVPVVAVDPVAGGGKVSAQARAWGWPALVCAGDVGGGVSAAALDRHLAWCLSHAGRAAARRAARAAVGAGAGDLARLVQLVTA